MRINIYKIISLFLILIIIALGFILYTDYKETYDFGGFVIDKQDFDNLASTQTGDRFVLCDVNKVKCVMIGRGSG